MASSETTEAAPTLEVRRTIHASQQRCFEAWTQPEKLRAFHAPGPLTVSFAEVDLRPGGSYRIHMQEPNGKEHCVSGVYREVDPPRKLVYTWDWDDDHAAKGSVVTIEFHDRGNATEVVLRHGGFANTKERDSHNQGWMGILEKFESTYSEPGSVTP